MSYIDFVKRLAKEKQDVIREWVEEMKTAERKVWKPENGKEMFFLEASGEVTPTFFFEGDKEDEQAYEQGNTFGTKEDAEFEALRRKYLATYERMSLEAGEASNPWDGNTFHFCAIYDGGIRIAGVCNTRDMNVHFPSEETCRNAVETIGEGNFKKYILKVRD